MFDQRGTGAGALQCPAMQRIMGTSDLTPPPPDAVKACAAAIGPKRRYFATADTVEDVEALRAALGAPRLTLDGVSYGTFVAERYALAHPNRVEKLVLDSVVPQEGADPFEVANMHSTARVLRAACRCKFDVAKDLATEVRRRHDGTKLLDLIVAMSVFDPTYAGVPQAIHEAAHGRTRALDALLARGSDGAPAEVLSQGLHASALCADTPFPWGGPATPIAKRAPALARAAARLRQRALWPFDRATATGNGFVRQCLPWPPMPTAPVHAARDLPDVPTLLLAGDRDLSTPLPWARAEAAHAPGSRLVVVPTAGHSVQLRAVNGAGRRALADFLRG
jgi:pimeloyl-ACP methyl ester carboxylesterase